MAEYIQIGITAARDAEGNFLPAVPLFIERTDAAERSAEGLIDDILPLMQARFARYAEESGLLEEKIAARAEVLEAATAAEAAEAAARSSASSSKEKQRGRREAAGR